MPALESNHYEPPLVTMPLPLLAVEADPVDDWVDAEPSVVLELELSVVVELSVELSLLVDDELLLAADDELLLAVAEDVVLPA